LSRPPSAKPSAASGLAALSVADWKGFWNRRGAAGKDEQSYFFTRRTCIIHLKKPIFKLNDRNAMLGYPYPRKIHAVNEFHVNNSAKLLRAAFSAGLP
jgi:hypothetical protein